MSTELGGELLLPPPALTTDNAAMIARAGQLAFKRGEQHDPRRLDARARQAWQPPGMRSGAQG
jgi:tRNA A37 threonylcarbamoyltransferase TsaD